MSHIYNIISKEKGNKPNKIYDIIYQVDNKPQKEVTKMICIKLSDELRYAWIGDHKAPYIETAEDRENFIKELKAFQKGASYRRTHPIAMSELDALYDQQNKLQQQMDDIKSKIQEVERNERLESINEYKSKISFKKVESFANKVSKLFLDGRFYVVPNRDKYSYTNRYMYIYDREINLPVATLEYSKDYSYLYVEELTDYDIENILDKK